MPLPVLSKGVKDGVAGTDTEGRFQQEQGPGHGHEHSRWLAVGSEDASDERKHGQDYSYGQDMSNEEGRYQGKQLQQQHRDFREGQAFIKSKSKSKSKSKLELKPKPKSTKMKQRPSSDEAKQMTKVKSKTSSKGKPKSKTKLCRKAKKQRELMDPDSAQYKLLHSDRSKLRRISRADLSKHILPSLAHINKVRLNEKPDGIWMMIHGYVFDIVNLLEHHPGGAECLLDCAGVDATRVFDDVGHSDIAWEMLENCCVGIMEDLEDSESGDDAEVEEAEGDDQKDENNNNKECEDSDANNIATNDNDKYDKDEGEEKKKKEKEKEKRSKEGRESSAGDVETDNGTAGTQLVWNYKVLEYSAIIVCALFGLFCFIVLQHKKWETWEGSETYS
ncbi:hypothetical protein PMKS-002847 [Pichia membranifaciens]|uniref:Cytochrome b5 heme-binding domain-containing protein n=2 Tax=Pichia membranifaciens TaxID=4926 RepID=A0A1Q2YIM2_9ASCO|nr:hypothetical protein PMKS-002847 [Pichia membranifaciens]